MTEEEKKELEYRKPKAVKRVQAKGMHMFTVFYRCPTCNDPIGVDYLYCSYCGQMLNWEEK